MKSQDAFGEHILYQYKNLPKKISEIIERDDGFIEAGNFSDRYF